MKKQVLTIRVSEGLKNDLRTLSEMNGESISDITRRALEDYVHHSKGKREKSIFEDTYSFKYSKIISILLNKEFRFEDSNIMDLFNEFRNLAEEINFDSSLKESYLEEFKRSKKETDNLNREVFYYLNDLLTIENEIHDFNFDDFSYYLTKLEKSVRESYVVYLEAPRQ